MHELPTLTLSNCAFIPIDYFYHQENGSKALALRATLRARLDNHFLMIFFTMGTKPLPHAQIKTLN